MTRALLFGLFVGALGSTAFAAEVDPPATPPAAERPATGPTPDPGPAAPSPEAEAPVPAPRSEASPSAARDQTATAPAANPDAPAAEQPPARPKEPPPPLSPLNPMFRFHVVIDTVWNTDRGYDLFSRDDVGPRAGVRAEFDLLRFDSATTLGLELGITSEDEDGGQILPEFYDPRLEATHVVLGVVPRYQFLEYFGVHGRAFGEAVWSTVTLGLSDQRLEHDSLDPLLGAGAGLSVTTRAFRAHPTRTTFNSLSFGGQIEGGYLWSPPLELAFPDRAASPPEQRLPVNGASFGSIDRHGPYVGVSAFLRL